MNGIETHNVKVTNKKFEERENILQEWNFSTSGEKAITRCTIRGQHCNTARLQLSWHRESFNKHIPLTLSFLLLKLDKRLFILIKDFPHA